MKRLLQAVDEFWFWEAPAQRLAMLRILIGAYTFGLVATHYVMWVKIGHSKPNLFQPVGVVAVLDKPLPPVVGQALLIATLAANVLFILGWHHRFTGPLFAALLLWILSYRQSWSMIYHSMNLPALHILILGLARAADALSLDSRRQPGATGGREPGAWQYGWPIRLICAVTVLAYFVTGFAKVTGPLGWSWATGEAMRSQVAADAIRKEVLGDAGGAIFYVLYHQVWLFTILGAASLAMELGAPVALFNRRLGQCWALGAFMMHWGILFIMGIKFRYHLSGILFASFFDVERLMPWCRKTLERWGAFRPRPVDLSSVPEPLKSLKLWARGRPWH